MYICQKLKFFIYFILSNPHLILLCFTGEFLQYDFKKQPQTSRFQILHVTRLEKDTSHQRRTIRALRGHFHHIGAQSGNGVIMRHMGTENIGACVYNVYRCGE